MSVPYLSLALLNYNEAATLERAARTCSGVLEECGFSYELLLVDDGSTDGSREMMEELVGKLPHCRAIYHPRNLGIGAGIRSCYFGGTAEWATWFPADLQADPRELPRLLEHLQDCDVLVTYRNPARRRENLKRKAISAVDRFLVRMLFGVQLRDLHWIRFFRRSVLERMELRSHSPFIDTEMIVAAKRSGARIQEVPLEDQPREFGAPKGARFATLCASLRDLLALRCSTLGQGLFFPIVAWLLLIVFLVVNVPPFVCMGLDNDVVMWDLSARTVLQGGALYRDALDNNFPGMLLPQMAVRSLLGWRSEAMRGVDVAVVLAICWMLARCLPSSCPPGSRAALALLLIAYYFSTSEWCHCQRDIWMLLPALIALNLRRGQIARLADPQATSTSIGGWALVEGMVWAVACWIKPFVAIPALACWLAGARQVWRGSDHPGRKLAFEGAVFLAGGLLVGAAGVAWLISMGAWASFVEIVFVWNREYISPDTMMNWGLVQGLLLLLAPWIYTHLLAVPLAVEQVWREGKPSNAEASTLTLLAVFYLAWFLQGVLLQRFWPYVQVPAILLGLTFLAVRWPSAQAMYRLLLTAFFLICVLASYQGLVQQRLALWRDCFREGGSARMHDELKIFPKTKWSDLEMVADFLRSQNVKDEELTCFSSTTSPLYLELGLRPSTRYFWLQSCLVSFKQQRGRIRAEVAATRQRFLVCDLEWFRSEVLKARLQNTEERLKPVYRQGPYVVFQLSGPEMPQWLEDNYGL
jgi:hypothetical protein